MFKQEYQNVFSQVTASGETYRRVMTMERKEHKHSALGIGTKLLLAAVMISLLAVTASAAGVKGWFSGLFEDLGGKPLSQEQRSWIDEKEYYIGQSQTQDGWSIELHSAITDGVYGYILLGITAPEERDLSEFLNSSTYYGTGNDYLPKSDNKVLSCSEGFFVGRIGSRFQDDGDGKNNTIHYVIDFVPTTMDGEGGEGGEALLQETVTWHIHIEDLVKGFPTQEVLAEGTWDFDFHFPPAEQAVELGTAQMQARVGIPQGEDQIAAVTLHSVQLRPLGLTVTYEVSREIVADDMQMVYFDTVPGEQGWTLVMKDGQEIALEWYDTNPLIRQTVFAVTEPILMENADHLVLGDGTCLPVP